jgi:hypothetical protein
VLSVLATPLRAGGSAALPGLRQAADLAGRYRAMCALLPVLASLDWAHRWHLVVLGAVAAGLAAVGFLGARGRWPGWRAAHIAGMSGAFVMALTAFYVDNGPRLPVWNLLPPIAFWFLPSVVGVPLLVRALRRHVTWGAVQPKPSSRAARPPL